MNFVLTVIRTQQAHPPDKPDQTKSGNRCSDLKLPSPAGECQCLPRWGLCCELGSTGEAGSGRAMRPCSVASELLPSVQIPPLKAGKEGKTHAMLSRAADNLTYCYLVNNVTSILINLVNIKFVLITELPTLLWGATQVVSCSWRDWIYRVAPGVMGRALSEHRSCCFAGLSSPIRVLSTVGRHCSRWHRHRCQQKKSLMWNRLLWPDTQYSLQPPDKGYRIQYACGGVGSGRRGAALPGETRQVHMDS